MGLFPKSKGSQSEVPGKHGTERPGRANAEWRRIRLIEGRLATLENSLTAVRRDVNRIDRRGYRELEREPHTSPNNGQSPSEADLLRLIP